MHRSELVNILNECESKIDRNNIDINLIKECLEKVILILNSFEYETDSRFVPYGRMISLKEELDKNLLNKNYLDAFNNICDYFKDSRISLNNNPTIVDKNIAYFNENKICSEEKQILTEMIEKYLLSVE